MMRLVRVLVHVIDLLVDLMISDDVINVGNGSWPTIDQLMNHLLMPMTTDG